MNGERKKVRIELRNGKKQVSVTNYFKKKSVDENLEKLVSTDAKSSNREEMKEFKPGIKQSLVET